MVIYITFAFTMGDNWKLNRTKVHGQKNEREKNGGASVHVLGL